MSDVTLIVKGHGLVGEGRAMYGESARCTCGAESLPLVSDAARKRWHRAHKQVIVAGMSRV